MSNWRHINSKNCLPFVSTWIHPPFLEGTVLFICLVFFVVLWFCFSSSCILCAQCCQCFWIVHSCLYLQLLLTPMFIKIPKNCSSEWNMKLINTTTPYQFYEDKILGRKLLLLSNYINGNNKLLFDEMAMSTSVN